MKYNERLYKDEARAERKRKLNFAAVIGKRISKRRRELRWSQQKLGDYYGISRAMISQIEIGNAEINAGDLPRMSLILQVPIAYLYGMVDLLGRATSEEERPKEMDAVDGSDLRRFMGIIGGDMGSTPTPQEEELLAYFRGMSSDVQSALVIMARAMGTLPR